MCRAEPCVLTAQRPLARGANGTQNPVHIMFTKPYALILHCLHLEEKDLELLQTDTGQLAKFGCYLSLHAQGMPSSVSHLTTLLACSTLLRTSLDP